MIPLAVSNPAIANDLCFQDITNARYRKCDRTHDDHRRSPPAASPAGLPSMLFPINPWFIRCIWDPDIPCTVESSDAGLRASVTSICGRRLFLESVV